MEKLLRTIRMNSKLTIVTQSIIFGLVVLYVLAFISGGLFTTFFIWLFTCIVGMLAAVLMLIRKSFLWAFIDVIIVCVMFMHFINNA